MNSNSEYDVRALGVSIGASDISVCNPAFRRELVFCQFQYITNFRLKESVGKKNGFSLRNLSALCGSAVNLLEKTANRRGAENAENLAEFLFPTDS